MPENGHENHHRIRFGSNSFKGVVFLTCTCIRLVLFWIIDADSYSDPDPDFTFRLLQKKILVSAPSCSEGVAIIHAHRHIHETGLEQNGVAI